MGIALSQVCCCSLRALYQILLIYSSPEGLRICLWQWERKERMNCCWVSTPGQEQAHLLQQSPVLRPYEQSQPQVSPANPPLLSSTATEATGTSLKRLNQVLLPQFQMTLCVRDCVHSGSVPQIAQCKARPWSGLLIPIVIKKNINNHNNLHCEKSMWAWITSSTCNNTSHLFNIKSLAVAPSCVIVCFPIISEHPESVLFSLGQGVQRWWGSSLDVAGETTRPRQQYCCVSSTPHSYWGEKHNKWDSSLFVTIPYSLSLGSECCLSLKK